MCYSVEFYAKPNGREPVKEFLAELNRKNPPLAARAVRDMDALAYGGPFLGAPRVKYVADGIYELRSKVGSDITRIFYFFYVGRRIILTNGFVKKTQKTPPQELEKAFRYKKEYEVNHDEL